ncbi:FAD-binding protein [Neorhizobium tomejilense]|uniref:FAD-binding protein n=1 Tax=Neorhizobium tomejilense TaxID=2093828 RepID=UPI000CF85722|nr:FAD-binding protein [Neorhizobium tomejilense]
MTLNRRRLLGGGLTCAAAFATDATKAAGAVERPALPAADTFNCCAEVVGEASEDFGHIIHRRPRSVFRPSSAAEVGTAIRWAGDRGLKVAARGQGHSTYGRSMADGGVVIDMRGINTVRRVDADRIVVGAGATWREVLIAALTSGLTPPVLTNYLELSVGGTLAVGGIGGSTSRHGMQTDNVLEMDVVTGAGRELTCSPDLNPDLFDAVRGGLGQCAVITRATLRLVRAPERVRRFQLFYPDFKSLAADQRLVLEDGRFDQLQGAVLPDGTGGWRYQLDGAVYYDSDAAPDPNVLAGLSDQRGAAVISDLTYLDDAVAFAKLETLLRSNGQWSNPHPWWLTFLRGSNAERLAAGILQDLTNEDVGPFGRITYYPLLTGALRTPSVRMPDEDVAFPFNIIRFPPSNNMAKIDAMVARNRALYESVRSEGGVLYPVSAFPMTSGDWQDHFGPAWPRLRQAKKRYDPRHTLTPGYQVF